MATLVTCDCGCTDAIDAPIKYSLHRPKVRIVDDPERYNLRSNGLPDVKEIIDAINELPWARWAQEQMARSEAEGDRDHAVDTVGDAIPASQRGKMAAVMDEEPMPERMSRQHAEAAMRYAAEFHQRGEPSPSWEACLEAVAPETYAAKKPAEQIGYEDIIRYAEHENARRDREGRPCVTYKEAKRALGVA